MKPIALVIPWYGDDIRGGAEQECNYLAHSLMTAGATVEVMTTCVKDASSDRGKNTLSAGSKMESGVLVRRFPVRHRDAAAFIKANSKIYNHTYGLSDEETYFKEDINSPEMYRYIKEHKYMYHCFIFIPYMYGPTFNGSRECSEKALLIPCLHDESYAYMRLVKEYVKNFQGLIFNSKPEAELADKLYDLKNIRTAILGVGIDTAWQDLCDPGAFRHKYNIYDNFMLYAGRKDAEKKTSELIHFFTRYKKRHPTSDLKLVLLGGGESTIEIAMQDQIFDLGFVSSNDKHNAYAAAAFFCNPSYYESFSIVIMESWLAKRPVLVSAHCAVTTGFCLETNGGLFYSNYAEFEACVNYLTNNREIANNMGVNGYQYVMNNFTHEIIADKYLRFINKVLPC
jgi:glycosyltransferase involved in cell wall biosynthesis